MAYSKLIQNHRAEILALAERHGARDIRVFGSMARGDDNLGSDVDLLVNFEETRSLWDHVALKQDIEELLGRAVDVVSEPAIHWFIRDRVLREAIPL
ncbi:MAG: nucleotidyltransferase family protein [Magnetococcales bacterium]|nr:nucleotidyltransferase family protein [Magnetococcales bacterium]